MGMGNIFQENTMKTDKCKYCGEINKHTHDHITKPGECFLCWFWKRNYEADQKEPSSFAIIDGHHYRIEGEAKDMGDFRGFAGRRFVIQFNDGRNVITTNLWSQGEISSYWKTKMPDNAVFVPAQEWKDFGGMSCLVRSK